MISAIVEFFGRYPALLPDALPRLIDGLEMTVVLTIVGLILSLAVGLVVALFGMAHWGVARGLVVAYVDLMRGTPVLTLLFVIYFGLSEIGIRLDPFEAAFVGFGIAGGAYMAEVYRGGFLAVAHGQTEAALAIGMSHLSVMRYVVLPQAVRVMIPPIANYGIGLLKYSSVASVVGVTELLYDGRALMQDTLLGMNIMLLVAVLYLVLSLPLAYMSARIERHLGRGVSHA